MPIEKIFNNTLPAKIDSKIKNIIKDSYFEAVDNIGYEEFEYVCKKIACKLKITGESATSWIVDLSKCYGILFKILNDHMKKRHKLSSEAFRLIGAALFYFINPFDIIPDYTPGIGYIDDLFVLFTCIKSLKKKDKEIVINHFQSFLEQQYAVK